MVSLLSEPCGSQWASPGRTDGLTSPQCILGVLGHGIGLIQYHQLEALPAGREGPRRKRQSELLWLLSKGILIESKAGNVCWSSVSLEDGSGAGKAQYGTSHDVDASVI